jgi:hypothetical protein
MIEPMHMPPCAAKRPRNSPEPVWETASWT